MNYDRAAALCEACRRHRINIAADPDASQADAWDRVTAWLARRGRISAKVHARLLATIEAMHGFENAGGGCEL